MERRQAPGHIDHKAQAEDCTAHNPLEEQAITCIVGLHWHKVAAKEQSYGVRREITGPCDIPVNTVET
jgi:hypothetical protein